MDQSETPLADQLKDELKREIFPEHSGWWRVARWCMRIAVAITLVTLALLSFVQAIQLQHSNDDARCRSQVVYSMLSAQNRLADALSTMPRDQALIDQAVANLHEVQANVQKLVTAGACGYSNTAVPSTTTGSP